MKSLIETETSRKLVVVDEFEYETFTKQMNLFTEMLFEVSTIFFHASTASLSKVRSRSAICFFD